MAPSAKCFPLLFLILALFFSQQIHARESQFFSKVSSNNNNVKVTELPNNEESLSKQDPTFIPETQSGYGLYGHESGQFPPTTTTNGETYTTSNIPYKSTESQEPLNNYPNSNTNNNNNYYYSNNAYETQQRSVPSPSETRLSERSYTPMANQDNNYYNGGNKYNAEKQGMSDTRFLENGRYYFNLKNENYYPSGYESSRGVNSRNEYNNGNAYEYNNAMYQNPEVYQEGQEVYVP